LCGWSAWAQQANPAQSPVTAIQQGQQLIKQGNLPEALDLFRALLISQPNSTSASLHAGEVLDLMGRHEQARQELSRALEMAGSAAEKAVAERALAISWAFGADCQKAVGYEQAALQRYVQANDVQRQAEAATEAADICLALGVPDVAHQWYLTSQTLAPNDLRWELAQAAVAARQGNQTVADEHFRAALAIAPKDAALSGMSGYLAFYRGDAAEALAQWGTASPANAQAARLGAEASEQVGQPARALEYYRVAAGFLSHDAPTAVARNLALRKLDLLGSKP
jgi:tetratricopeptide (TPR) repeat protein